MYAYITIIVYIYIYMFIYVFYTACLYILLIYIYIHLYMRLFCFGCQLSLDGKLMLSCEGGRGEGGRSSGARGTQHSTTHSSTHSSPVCILWDAVSAVRLSTFSPHLERYTPYYSQSHNQSLSPSVPYLLIPLVP